MGVWHDRRISRVKIRVQTLATIQSSEVLQRWDVDSLSEQFRRPVAVHEEMNTGVRGLHLVPAYAATFPFQYLCVLSLLLPNLAMGVPLSRSRGRGFRTRRVLSNTFASY